MIKKITPDQYRTRYFDDLVVGERFDSNYEQVSEAEIVRFATEFDRQYFHIDVEAAKNSPFGGVIASGAHTFALWNRINLEVNGDIAWIAGLGFDEFRFPHPLRPAVEFRATSELLEVRPSKPGRGLAIHQYQLITRDDEVLFTCRCPALVHVR